MKTTFTKHQLFALVVLLVLTSISSLFSQSVFSLTQDEMTEASFNNHIYVELTTTKKLTVKEQNELTAQGVVLLSSIDAKTYLAKLPTQFNANAISGLVADVVIPTYTKSSTATKSLEFPTYALSGANKVRLNVVFQADFTKKGAMVAALSSYNATVLRTQQHLAVIELDKNQVNDLTAEPFIVLVEPIEEPAQPLNYETVKGTNANYLSSTVAGMQGLSGNGVAVGIGDGGELGEHIDFGSRVLNFANGTYAHFGNHGDHVSGTVGSAGNINPRHTGIASDVTLLTHKTSQIISDVDTLVNTHGMVLSNNSYGSTFICSTSGQYDYISGWIDGQAALYPDLLHVYAAGNSGSTACSSYPSGFGTLLKSYQATKNTLVVGSVDYKNELAGSSSRGPALDGRVKPEICGVGIGVTSTNQANGYTTKSGTSMAAPTVTSALALLVEQYRNENAGANPKAGLLKAIACNTADDLGNVGVDFKHGFGLINAKRASEVMTNDQYFSGSVSQGDSMAFTFTVPAGLKETKVLLNWMDKAAAAFAAPALINDLDLRVVAPNGTSYRPWVLDHTPANVNNLPTRKKDNLNTLEQFTLTNPAPGTYTIYVSGNQIPLGNQAFFVTYDNVEANLTLTYPLGNEMMVPGQTEYIRFDNNTPNSAVTVSFSTDNGASWNVLGTSTSDYLSWVVPSTFTDEAMIKVSTGSQNSQSTASFTILSTPSNLVISDICNGKISLAWDAISSISNYEVFVYNDTIMASVGTTSNTSFEIENLAIGEEVWVSVAAKTTNGNVGRRANAINYTTNATGPCATNLNMTVANLEVKPLGRFGTSSALGMEPVSISVVNTGAVEVSEIDLGYSINGGTIVYETFLDTVAPGDTLNYVFTTPANLINLGNYVFNAYVEAAGDSTQADNQLIAAATAQQIPNFNVMLPFFEDFESLPTATVTTPTYGLFGVPFADYFPTNGILTTEGIEGGKGVRLETTINPTSGTAALNEIVFYLNLSAYDITDNITVQFDYEYLASTANVNDKICIRGNDTDEWLDLYVLTHSDEIVTVENIGLTAMLASMGQTLSSSFQMKIIQAGEQGYKLDNLSIIDNGSGTLPVELTSFSAKKVSTDVQLTWTTASEKNNAFFEIEVAEGDDALEFDEFKVLGAIHGNGSTTSVNDYEFLDTENGKSGIRYYRLKQVNFDGSFEYSQVIAVPFTTNEVGNISTSVFPNPFVEEINVGIETYTAANLSIELIDMNGQVLQSFFSAVDEGTHNFTQQVTQDLAPGMYLLKIQLDNLTRVHTLYQSEL